MSSKKDHKICKISRKMLSMFEDNDYRNKSYIIVETYMATTLGSTVLKGLLEDLKAMFWSARSPRLPFLFL
jgi:hypothetical protein